MNDVIHMRLPEWVNEHIEKVSKEKTIPKTTVVRMYLVERLRQIEAEAEE